MSLPLRPDARRFGGTDPLLTGCGVDHSFGTRGSQPPPFSARPQQVHGKRVAVAARLSGDDVACLGEADAVVSREPGLALTIATADCVPILASAPDGAAVAVVHAGWRGLALGVVAAAIDALRDLSDGGEIVAAIGPHAAACCYEIDEPVIAALRQRFDAAVVDESLLATRPGHWRVDLAKLASDELERAGVDAAARSTACAVCTVCHPEHFHSFRRDGSSAGRLIHHITARRDRP